MRQHERVSRYLTTGASTRRVSLCGDSMRAPAGLSLGASTNDDVMGRALSALGDRPLGIVPLFATLLAGGGGRSTPDDRADAGQRRLSDCRAWNQIVWLVPAAVSFRQPRREGLDGERSRLRSAPPVPSRTASERSRGAVLTVFFFTQQPSALPSRTSDCSLYTVSDGIATPHCLLTYCIRARFDQNARNSRQHCAKT